MVVHGRHLLTVTESSRCSQTRTVPTQPAGPPCSPTRTVPIASPTHGLAVQPASHRAYCLPDPPARRAARLTPCLLSTQPAGPPCSPTRTVPIASPTHGLAVQPASHRAYCLPDPPARRAARLAPCLLPTRPAGSPCSPPRTVPTAYPTRQLAVQPASHRAYCLPDPPARRAARLTPCLLPTRPASSPCSPPHTVPTAYPTRQLAVQPASHRAYCLPDPPARRAASLAPCLLPPRPASSPCSPPRTVPTAYPTRQLAVQPASHRAYCLPDPPARRAARLAPCLLPTRPAGSPCSQPRTVPIASPTRQLAVQPASHRAYCLPDPPARRAARLAPCLLPTRPASSPCSPPRTVPTVRVFTDVRPAYLA